MGKNFILMFIVAAVSTMPTCGATAEPCRGRSHDNPMVASAGFGAASCATRRPRYHSRDHLREGARGYARRNVSDPMVWSDSQWRGTLMGGYARDYDSRFDRRFRHAGPGAGRVVRSIAEVIITNEPNVTAADEPARPPRHSKVIRVHAGKTDVMENRVGFAGHKCPGILVLRWGAAGSRARCYNDQGRVRRLR